MMIQPVPESGLEEVAQLGEAKLVCRTSRKTLFWTFLLASLLCGFGIALLILVLRILTADWSKDVFGCIVFLAVASLSLWGAKALWRKANRLRQVQVVVHAGGLSYRDDSTCLTCRWDQIEAVRWRVSDHHEESLIGIRGMPIPVLIPAKTTWTTHQVTVKRKDGVQLVFTDELQDVVRLAKAIQQETTRNIGCD
jgi:hypothetical protein